MSDDQLRARLRDADPAASLPPADPDRVSRLLEDAMALDTETESRQTGFRGRSRLTWLVAAAAVVLIALGVAYAVLRQPLTTVPLEEAAPAPDTLELALSDASAAGRCMTPTPATLGRAEVAFDGEVASVSDGRVVLRPTQFYAGGPADQVEVAQASQSRQDLILGVRFEEGSRYLVAANGGDVMVCGFSGGYDEELADLYAQAFAG
jgi:hypothetical protein